MVRKWSDSQNLPLKRAERLQNIPVLEVQILSPRFFIRVRYFCFGQEKIDSVLVGMVTPLEVEWNVPFLSVLPIAAELARNTTLQIKRLNILEVVCTGCGECVAHSESGPFDN